MPTNHRLAGLALSALALLAAACASPSTSVTPMLGSLSLDGSLGAGTDGGAGSTSFNALGLDGYEATPGVKAQLGLLGGLLSVSAFQTEYEGVGTTQSAFEIGDQSIGANSDVDTQLELLLARALFTWNLIPLGPVEFGIGFGASVIDVDFSMTDQATGDRLESEEALPVPLAALRAAWTWGPVWMRAVVSGITYTLDSDKIRVFDGDLEASVKLYDAGALVVGYRIVDIEAEYEDGRDMIDADLDLAGFYFGVRFTF